MKNKYDFNDVMMIGTIILFIGPIVIVLSPLLLLIWGLGKIGCKLCDTYDCYVANKRKK